LSTFDIYGLGAALVDTEIEVTNQDLQGFAIPKGVMTLVDEDRQTELINLLSDHLCQSKRASGGSAANSILAAQCFGASTFYSCKVANDDNGKFYLEDLRSAGVKHQDNAGDCTGITGKCLVMITPDAERTMNTFLGVSETLSIEELHPDAIKDSKFIYTEGYLVTSPTGKTAAIQLREIAESNGVKTSISLSDPFIVEHFKDGLKEMIGNKVDVLFCNRDEAFAFSGSKTIEEAADKLKEFATSFAITLGADGAYIFDGKEAFKVPSPKVQALDTNGAGDMFAGAFLYELTKGSTYLEAAQLAVKAASKVVSQYGPRLMPEQHKELLSPS